MTQPTLERWPMDLWQLAWEGRTTKDMYWLRPWWLRAVADFQGGRETAWWYYHPHGGKPLRVQAGDDAPLARYDAQNPLARPPVRAGQVWAWPEWHEGHTNVFTGDRAYEGFWAVHEVLYTAIETVGSWDAVLSSPLAILTSNPCGLLWADHRTIPAELAGESHE